MMSSGVLVRIVFSRLARTAVMTAGMSYGLASISVATLCAVSVDSTPTSNSTSSLRGK